MRSKYSDRHRSVELYKNAVWPKKANDYMWKLYLKGVDKETVKLAAPLNMDHFTGLPSAYVEPQEIDILRDEGIAYAKKLEQKSGLDVISVGKISDIFDGEGITESNKSKSSVHGMEQTIEIARRDFQGFCYVNLVDFDALWGHRRDPEGYAQEIEKFDVKLGELLPLLKEDDLLIITADHGNDPTHTGTDHTREHVPLLMYSPGMKGYGALEEMDTFTVIGATIAENFEVEIPEGTIGHSILSKIN